MLPELNIQVPIPFHYNTQQSTTTYHPTIINHYHYYSIIASFPPLLDWWYQHRTVLLFYFCPRRYKFPSTNFAVVRNWIFFNFILPKKFQFPVYKFCGSKKLDLLSQSPLYEFCGSKKLDLLFNFVLPKTLQNSPSTNFAVVRNRIFLKF